MCVFDVFVICLWCVWYIGRSFCVTLFERWARLGGDARARTRARVLSVCARSVCCSVCFDVSTSVLSECCELKYVCLVYLNVCVILLVWA